MTLLHVNRFVLIALCIFQITCPALGQASNRETERSGRGHVIKILSTNTRSGFVDVDRIVNSPQGQQVLDRSVVPDNIYHGSLQAYGRVYDFIIDKGIIISDEGEYYNNTNPLWVDGEFKTYKTEAQFLRWLAKEQEENFTLTSYRLADNNCLTFVYKAVKFLGGKEPRKLWKLRQFALNNRKNMDVLQALYRAWAPALPAEN